MQPPIRDDDKLQCLSSPKKKVDVCDKKEASPIKERVFNINDWTRPVRPNMSTSETPSPQKENKSVKLRWEEKDEKLNGKYTFDLIKEPSAKRQKIVVRFKQTQEVNDTVDGNEIKKNVLLCKEYRVQWYQ